MSTPSHVRLLRGVVLVGAVIYMQAGSFARMGLGMRTGPAFQSWRMYHSRGHDQCKVWAYELRDDGSVQPIDWSARLTPVGERPQRADHRIDATRIASKLCKELPNTSSVSTVMQCARKRRWRSPTPTKDIPMCRGRVAP